MNTSICFLLHFKCSALLSWSENDVPLYQARLLMVLRVKHRYNTQLFLQQKYVNGARLEQDIFDIKWSVFLLTFFPYQFYEKKVS